MISSVTPSVFDIDQGMTTAASYFIRHAIDYTDKINSAPAPVAHQEVCPGAVTGDAIMDGLKFFNNA